MMLYQITALGAADMSSDIALPSRPSRPKERAVNTNWDRHVLYAEYVDPEPSELQARTLRSMGMVSDKPELEWRPADKLTPSGQRRHGAGPLIDAEREESRKRSIASARAVIAEIPGITNDVTGYRLEVDADGCVVGEGTYEQVNSAFESAPLEWRERVVEARKALIHAERM